VVGVPIVPRGTGHLRLVLNYLSFVVSAALLGSWKLRGRRFDVIFVWESSPITVGLPAIVFRAIKRAPMAFWVLDLWPETLQAVGVVRSTRMLRLVGKLVTFIYARCDLILAQSHSFVPQIARWCRRETWIEYFPVWPESVFERGDTHPAVEVPVVEGSFNVMFAGNIGEAQDFPAILAAAELLKEHRHIRWLVVGDGSVAAWVKSEIVRRGLQDRVLMLGRYPVERMPAFYRHANALLVALKDEPIFAMTIPGKLQSYLAAGIPVVAMLNGEGADVVNRFGAGVTCPAGDSAALAAAVLKLAALPRQELERMGANGAQASATEFDRHRLITRLEGWLERLVQHWRTAT
jgi:colanic acid biosynthesis glycosyl transferase WcaI